MQTESRSYSRCDEIKTAAPATPPSADVLGQPRAAFGIEPLPGFVEQEQLRLISAEQHAQSKQLPAAPRQVADPPAIVRGDAEQRRPPAGRQLTEGNVISPP